MVTHEKAMDKDFFNGQPIRVIAEIGCNHNGDRMLARKMVEEARKCGVDGVKFQTFDSGMLISRYAPKAEYQKITTGTEDSQLEMTRKLELSREDFIELSEYAKELGLMSFSTPFDHGSMDFLNEYGQKIWKIPSGEITNLPYLEKIGNIAASPGHTVILSTGMAIIPEIRECVDILTRSGLDSERLIILHCNTEYPTPDCDVNLTAIRAIQREFPGIRTGFSDHSVGSVAAVAAATMGIVMIEKHFTLDKDLPGPDHKASATPEELSELVRDVRRVEAMLGEDDKHVTASERGNMVVARKSIVALRSIREGEIFSEDNICCKRPGSGISPMQWYDVLGRKAERAFEEDELIEVAGIKWQK